MLLAFALLIVLLVVWAVLVAIAVYDAQSEARAGEKAVRQLRERTELRDVLDGDLRPVLVDVQEHFAAADEAISRPWMGPARHLPILGRQIRSADALAETAVDLAETGLDSVDRTRAALDSPDLTGAGRVALVTELGAVVTDARDRLGAVDLGPSDALFAPLADARTELAEELAELDVKLADAETSIGGLRTLLQGPSRYVMVAANNAEMRAGSGMWLQAGLLEIDDGEIHLSGMDESYSRNPAPGAVPVAGDLEARWGWSEPSVDWRNLELSPRFDASAELALDMWESVEGERAQGVIVVDPFALAALLQFTGPAPSPDGEIGGDRAVDYLTFEQYTGIGSTEENLARRDAAGELAGEVVELVDGAEIDPAEAADILGDVVAGRHLLGFSTDPEVDGAFRVVGMDGRLTERSIAVNVMNRGGDKLDPFVNVGVNTESHELPEGETEVVVAVTVRSEATDDLPGVLTGSHMGDGTYTGIVSLNVPQMATDLQLLTSGEKIAEGPDGPTHVIASRVTVAPRSRETVTFSFRLPPGMTEATIEPSARSNPVTWKVGDRPAIDDTRRTTVDFGS